MIARRFTLGAPKGRLAVLGMGLLAWAGLLLAPGPGQSQPAGPGPTPPPTPSPAPTPAPTATVPSPSPNPTPAASPVPEDLAEGQALFRGLCSGCHGGAGRGGKGPDLTDSRWIHGGTDDAIARVIREGVPKSTMKKMGESLKPDQVNK